MKLQTNCPCCAQNAMSLWRKLTLSRHAAHPCRFCGVPLGVEQAGSVWFLIGWLPFSLSGLFPLPIKFVLGVVGIGLIIFPHAYLIPLVNKSEKPGHPLSGWLVPWLMVVLVGMFSTDWINLLPTEGAKIIAVGLSVLLTILVVREFRLEIPKPDDKQKLGFVVGSALVFGMHYFALSILPASVLAVIAGDQRAFEAEIIGKSHTNKFTRCANKIDIVKTGEVQKHEICIHEDRWKQLKNGDRVTLIALNTAYGSLVTAVELGGINQPQEKTTRR